MDIAGLALQTLFQLPAGWYPEPQFYWLVEGKLLNATNRVFPLEIDVGGKMLGSTYILGLDVPRFLSFYSCVNIHKLTELK